MTDLIRNMFQEFHRENLKREEAAARAAPEKHKLSRVIADGKPASYSYYVAPVKAVNGRARRRVRWCFTDFWQVETKRTVKRTQHRAHKHQYLADMRCEKMARGKA